MTALTALAEIVAVPPVDVGPAGQVLAQPPAGAPTVDAILTNVRNWIMGILALFATVCWTVAGLRYVASNGDVSQVERAKAGVRAGAWGYAIAALAPLIAEILRSIVGV